MHETGGIDHQTTSNGGRTADELTESSSAAPQAPAISLPEGGGAIKGIGEKFAANLVTGSGLLTIPLPARPGHSGFGPQIILNCNSGAANGLFDFDWHLTIPIVTRKTNKGLPRYAGSPEDIFIPISDGINRAQM
jgi:hypothetical protein